MFLDISAAPVRIVLDTNVVMDMLHFRDARTARLKEAIDTGSIRCFSDAPCLAELERVVAYPEFALDSAGQNRLVETYQGMVAPCEAVMADASLPRCRDADDQKFLELAARCRAAMLVTRDKLLLKLARHRHKPPPFAIVTAEEADRLLEPAAKDPTRTV